MASQYGVDLAEVYRDSENIKNSRQARENNALLMDWKKEDRKTEKDRAAKLGTLRTAAASGNKQDLTNLVTFDPEEGKKVIDAFSKMDDMQRQQAKENNDKAGRLASYILQSENPEAAYQQSLQMYPPEVSKTMPQQYDPQFVQLQLARAREIDDMLSNPEAITFGDQDRLYKDGKMVESTTSNALLRAREKGKDSGAGGLKSSDEALIYRQAGELLGGIFDQQGNLQNLDPDTRGKVQAIATEGAKIYKASGGDITRSEAATMAARKLGIQVKDLSIKGGENLDGNALLKMYGPKQ